MLGGEAIDVVDNMLDCSTSATDSVLFRSEREMSCVPVAFVMNRADVEPTSAKQQLFVDVICLCLGIVRHSQPAMRELRNAGVMTFRHGYLSQCLGTYSWKCRLHPCYWWIRADIVATFTPRKDKGNGARFLETQIDERILGISKRGKVATILDLDGLHRILACLDGKVLLSRRAYDGVGSLSTTVTAILPIIPVLGVLLVRSSS